MPVVTPGRLIVVGGHSRGVGKTALVVELVRSLGWPRLATVKVSAHRHGVGPAWLEDRDPSSATSTGRSLMAGAARAFLCRCPDVWLPAASARVRSLLDDGWDVVVESNRLAAWLDADLTLFVVSAATDDWKASSSDAARRADVVVLAPGTKAIPRAAWRRADGAPNPRVLAFADDWTVPGLASVLSATAGRRVLGQAGTTAVASISTFARGSTSATTCTADIAMS